MDRFSPDEVTEEDLDHFIEWLAEEIQKRGLEAPTMLFLEAHKPLGNIFAHMFMFFSPLSLAFIGQDKTNAFLRMISSRENIEKLQVRLEEKKSP